MIDNSPIYYKNRLIQIFRDHWEGFKQFHPDLVNEDTEVNVQKMMNCGLFSGGYAEYRCSCGYVRRVPFSCKSRFCLCCSKVYIDNWVTKMKQTIFAKVEHRHIILTVPSELWKYFHSAQMLKLIEEVFQKTSSFDFIARAKKEKVRKTDIIGYLIKYVASPPIALYR